MRAPAPAPPTEAPTGERRFVRHQRKALRRIQEEIFAERNPDQLLQNFVVESTANARFRYWPRVYEAAVSRLASFGRHDAVTALIESQKPFLEAEKEDFAARLVCLYVLASMPSHAAATFRDLPPQHKSVNSFNAILAAYVDSGYFDALATAFQEIPASCTTVVPSVYSYNILINGLCKKPDLSAALDVIALMEKRGLSPDMVSFNTLLKGFYHNGTLDEAGKVWDMMKERNVEPDTKSYNAKLQGLVAKNMIEDAAALIEEMEKDGPRPDTECYNALIKGYSTQGNLNAAKKVFDDLVEMTGDDRPKPDTFSYNELIKVYCKKGRLDDAEKVYNDLVKNECVPTAETFGTLVPCLVEAGELDCALNCCHEIFSTKCRVHSSLLQGVITALVAASRVEEATQLLKLAQRNRYPRKHFVMPHIETKDVEAEADQGDSISSARDFEAKEESGNT
jgi:pentatricopeptide repeat protein